MKLELKHLAPYLPYGLKIQGQTHGEIAELSSINEYNVNIKDRGFQYGWWADIFDIKPILRPLSDLTKEIDVNGKFIPLEALAIHLFDKDTQDSILEFATNGIPYCVMIELFKNHFDVFGLIEKGLAIDINTL